MLTDAAPTDIADAVLFRPRVFDDARGSFHESFNARDYARELKIRTDFVQDNQSTSKRGVLRGLHYQTQQTQGKLVRVLRGAVFDVIVDLRKSAPSFGRWVGCELSAESRQQLWIPPGLAHGFLSLTDDSEILYKVTDYWHPASEQTLRWDDPTLAIRWPLAAGTRPIVSAKDAAGLTWQDAPKFD